MRHFCFLERADDDLLFHLPPAAFTASDARSVLEMALGATLYMPGTRASICADLGGNREAGSTSMVLCLEDAITDREVAAAEANIVAQLRAFDEQGSEPPLLFIRVRRPDQITDLTRALGPAARILTGYVLPKFTAATGPALLRSLEDASDLAGRRLYAMPVLESPEIMYAEVRLPSLLAIRELLDAHRDAVLAVRTGATDLAGLYGLRRERDLASWDIALLSDVLADIVNIFARGGDYVVTGPVWEHFVGGERIFKPQVREGPFLRPDLPGGRALRSHLVANALDGFLREVVLDRATGMLGKTVIHPSHVRLVHALSAVTHEEYVDAGAIVALTDGGVTRSSYANKMNEGRPHLLWATQTLRRAAAFGVLAADRTFVDLLDEEWRHA